MCVEMRIYMITGTIKKNWKMLITVLAAVIGVLAVYQPENAVCYAADNDTSAIEIRTSKDLLEASKNSDGSYVLMADIDMSVFGVDGWKPWNFNGTFDEVFNEYTTDVTLEKVRTTNLGSMYELTYNISLKKDADQKKFIDDLRCRNGNLNITLCNAETKELL